jgi:hypothetical protein
MSNIVRMRIKEGYNAIRGDNDEDWNPVKKVPLVITRVENQLVIDKLLPGSDGPGDGGAPLHAGANLPIGSSGTAAGGTESRPSSLAGVGGHKTTFG